MSSTIMDRSVTSPSRRARQPKWRATVGKGVISGLLAGLTSAVMLMICGRLSGTTAAGPLNGPSQWLFGREGAERRALTLRETGTGFLIHQLSAVWWGVIHQRWIATPRPRRTMEQMVRSAAATTALAASVDYGLTPRRLQPGFEAQLPGRALVAVYAAFAAGLVIADVLEARRRGGGRHGRSVSRPRRRPAT